MVNNKAHKYFMMFFQYNDDSTMSPKHTIPILLYASTQSWYSQAFSFASVLITDFNDPIVSAERVFFNNMTI